MGNQTKVAVGVDIGGTNTVFGLVNRAGEVLWEASIPTNSNDDPELFVELLAAGVQRAMGTFGQSWELIGVGIGAPNGNHFTGSIEFAPNLQWKGIVPIQQLAEDKFNLPTFLTNDANAAAIGEMLFGVAQEMKDFVIITLGTGVGGGIVTNGQIVYGHDGFAGEIGHTLSIPEGRLCGCGRKGCFETYLSGPGIKRTVQELLGQWDAESVLRSLDKAALTPKAIHEAAQQGDKIALEAFERSGEIMGKKFADMVCYTSPEAIILFGGIARAGDFLIEPAKRYMEANMLKIFQNKVKVLASGLLDVNAAILGASALVWQGMEVKIPSELGQ